MKKTLSLLVVLTLMLCLLSTTAFAQAAIIFEGESGDGVVSNNAQPAPAPVTVIDGNGTIISTTDPAVVVISGDVQVTKSPTSETFQEGGKATFVAHAANATGITWRLVSSDGMATINASAASMYFDGVTVWGLGTDSLTISNIPANMNHWQVEAKFDGPNGPVYSAGARISVIGSNANGTTTDRDPNGRVVANTGVANGTSPVITSQPEGAELTSGKSTTLSVTASVSDGSTIRYQWYVSTSNDNAAGQAIAGATSASYTPGEIQGTRYYYVGVWSEKDGAKSDTVFSAPAAVVYTGPAIAADPNAGAQTGGDNTGSNTNTNTNTNTNPSSGNTGTANGTAGNTAVSTNNGTTPVSADNPIAADPNAAGEQTVTPVEGEQTTAVNEAAPDAATEARSSLPVVLGAIAAVALAAGVGLLVLRRNAGQ